MGFHTDTARSLRGYVLGIALEGLDYIFRLIAISSALLTHFGRLGAPKGGLGGMCTP